MNVSICPRPFANDLLGLVVGMLEKAISQIESSFASCYGLVDIKVNEDTGKVSSWVELANVHKQCVEMWAISMDFLNGGPQYDQYNCSCYSEDYHIGKQYTAGIVGTKSVFVKNTKKYFDFGNSPNY